MLKTLFIVSSLTLVSSSVTAEDRLKINAEMYADAHESFYSTCVIEASEYGTPEEADVFCGCGANFYIKNMKAFVKKRKLVYQDQVLEYQDEANCTRAQINVCGEKLRHMK